MKIEASRASVAEISADMLIVLAGKDEMRAPAKGRKSKVPRSGTSLAALDGACGGLVTRELRRRGFKGGDGEIAVLAPVTDRLGSVVVTGWQPRRGIAEFEQLSAFRRLGAMLYEQAEKLQARKVCLSAHHIDIDDDRVAAALLEGIMLSGYRFLRYKTPEARTWRGIDEITVLSQRRISARVVGELQIMCDATSMARDLVNMPPRDCTPTFIARKAREVAKRGKLGIKIFDRAQLARMGANALLAVAQGSTEPPYLIRLHYKPRGRSSKVVNLVGKGITFDSGGLSIKTAAGMETMKCDMAGAAAVLATMQAIAALKPRVEVRAYIPTCENMINGHATRPGDVVRAMNGKSIEILNTDAEGRLILADALSLVGREKGDLIIDLATLTGACVVALGTEYAGLFSNDDKLAERLIGAGVLSGERLWRMPLASEYRDLIKGAVADIKNTGGPWGGAITAALFLKEFVPESAKWAHIDIAGPAFAEGARSHIHKGGVGFGVRTLIRYLQGR